MNCVLRAAYVPLFSIAFVVGELNWDFPIFTVSHSYAESCTAAKNVEICYAPAAAVCFYGKSSFVLGLSSSG